MRTRTCLLGSMAITLLSGSVAFAGGPINIGDFSGSEQVITFDPGFTTQCAPLLYENVIFSENGGGTGGPCYRANSDWGSWFANIPGASGGIGFNDQWGDSLIIMEPPAGTTRFGCLLSTSPITVFTMNLYDANNNLIGSDTRSMPNTSQAVFIGYQTDVDIARVEISEPNGENGNITLMDDVRFEGGPTDCLTMTVSTLIAGQNASWDVSGATPGALVAVVYGLQPGSTVVNGQLGFCATFGIQGVTQNSVVGTQVADGAGNASINKMIPRQAAGVTILTQAAEQGTCPNECMSGVDTQVVQ